MFKYILCAVLAISSAHTWAARVRCADFDTQAEAQAYFLKYNAYWLDGDHDGEACECLPGGSKDGNPICSR